MTTPSTTIEIELRLDGHVSRYRPATYWDPAEGGDVDDLAVDDVGTLTYIAPKVPGGRADWAFDSILTGVDRDNPEVRKLLDNLLNAVWDKAEDAVREAA